MHRLIALATASILTVLSACASAPMQAALPARTALDATVERAMAATGARGLAIAVIDDGHVVLATTHGVRNARGEPLEADTVMYGASITKAVFATLVLQLADEGRIGLDASIATYLPKPLPSYASEDDADRYSTWGDLAGDERWRAITPRILLTHSAGFANFGFLEPDHKLRIHFAPGSRYAYSGDGMMLLQFVLERGLGLDVGGELQRRVFDPLGMRDTSLQWRPAFARNLADGFTADGSVEPHDERSTVRAAGSMDTTLDDLARFAAALVRGDLVSPNAFATMTSPQLPITTASQFPTLQPQLPPAARRADLASGLGVVVFDGPQGRGFYKGGHNDSTGNTLVCLVRGRRCVVILSNDVRAEAAFPALARAVLGATGMPWTWEYGDLQFWDGR